MANVVIGTGNLQRVLSGAIAWASCLLGGILAAWLVAAIWLTAPEVRWLAFLSGIFMAASLALASSLAHSRRHASELELARSTLAAETGRRERAEQGAVVASHSQRYVDEILPSMLVYLDRERTVRFHNRAYAEWLASAGDRLEGRGAQELLGAAWTGVRQRLDDAYAGSVVRYERTQRSRDGHLLRIAAHYVPHFGANGEVVGVFALMTDITCREDRAQAAPAAPRDPRAEAALQLARAIDHGEFSLYIRDIVPTHQGARGEPIRELLLRLATVEGDIAPFLEELAEHRLLADIELWEVRRLLEWTSVSPALEGAVYGVRISADAIADRRLLACVRDHGTRNGGGATLCFEIAEHDARADLAATRSFVAQLRALGSRFALSGCGPDSGSEALARELRPDYLMIDPSLVLSAQASPVDLGRIESISRLAHEIGAAAVAEGVEGGLVQQFLAGAGVDFAQGPGLSPTRPLHQAAACL